MNKPRILKVTSIILAAGFLFYAVYLSRYSFQPGPDGAIYKIDHFSGRTWLVTGAAQIEVQDFIKRENKSPEERAILLAKDFKNYPGSSLDADFLIRKFLEEWHGELKIEGWKAQRINDDVYLVSYEFQCNPHYYDSGLNTTLGWYYEVNLAGGIVRDIGGDVELKRRYSISGAVPWGGHSFMADRIMADRIIGVYSKKKKH